MQLLLTPGSTGTMTIDGTPRDVPITQPVLAAGAVELSGQLFIPSDVSNTARAELVYRWLPTDEPTDAGTWQSTGQTKTGPGKVHVSASITTVDGLMIQAGVRLDDTVSGTTYGRASLQYPVLVVT